MFSISGLVVRLKKDEPMVIFADNRAIEIRKIRGGDSVELLVVADRDVRVCRPGTAEKIDGQWHETEESKARRA